MFDYTDDAKVKKALKWTDDAKAGDSKLSEQEKYFLEALFAFDMADLDSRDESSQTASNNYQEDPFLFKLLALERKDINQFLNNYDFSGGEKHKIHRILDDAKDVFYKDFQGSTLKF
jgi:hypothetical protein